MKIVRTVWGNLSHTIAETEGKYFFEDEIVYVWGIENEDHLKRMGYKTFLMSTEESDLRYSTQLMKYMHKLLAIQMADENHEEYILLDWDSSLSRELDEEFLKLLRSRGKVQCPLYCLPNNFYDLISKYALSDEMSIFFKKQNELICDHSWNFNEFRVIPNFSFFYSNKAKIGKELIEIAKSNEITSNIEEFSLFIWANCSLDEWINEYEPLVAIGQKTDSMEEVSRGLSLLNVHIDSVLSKKIYINHKL